ncbi:MAG: HEAT repeat domain-containing protein [Planctomycetota bacterium]|jgi:hypothetical protein
MDRAAKYIRELRSSTALMRKFAARYLKDYGDERAVEPLVRALGDVHAEVRREAARTLASIGDERALDALRKAGKDADARVAKAAREAVKTVESRTAPPPPPKPAASDAGDDRPPDRTALLRAALQGVDGSIAERKYGFKITVELVDGRKQYVRVVTDRSDPDGDPLLLFFTLCCEADPERYAWALKANARLPLGALAIREVGGREQLILMETFLEDHASVDEIRKAVLTLAEKGDYIENRITGKDNF